MKDPEFTRKGKQVINLSTGEVKDFKTINQAKSHSHTLQMEADKGLGRGTLRRIARKRKQREKTFNPRLGRQLALQST